MPDFKKMSVESLRELARKVIGPGHTRLKTKTELVNALEAANSSKATRPSAKETPVKETRARATTGKASGKPASAKAAPAKAASTKAASTKTASSKTASSKTASSKEAPLARVKAAATRAAEATGKAVRAATAAAGKVAEEAGKVAAGKAGKVAAAVGAVTGAKAERSRAAKKPGKVAAAAAAVAGAAVEAAAGLRKKGKAAAEKVRAAGSSRGPRSSGPDPEGYFVARVRGEDAVRAAPHPMQEDSEEDGVYEEPVQVGTQFDEGLGDLPPGYGDDAFIALPRDPRTLYVYWDHATPTVEGGFSGLEAPRAQLWLFARTGADWERVRVLDFALESRGYYLHDLEPGRVYRVEIHAIDRQGRGRRVGPPSNEMGLPPVGPSQIVDDRFIRIPWDVPFGRLLGPGHAGGPFSDEARALLARLSDWSRFTSKAVWGGSAGTPGDRPSSPTSAPSSPGAAPTSPAPTSPGGPFGPGVR
jgi:uncharacterized protein